MSVLLSCGQLQSYTNGDLVLVAGATGRQGAAVVNELMGRGYRIRALTRKPSSDAAQALAARGIDVVKGDYGDIPSLDAALKGVDKLFFYSGFSRNELEEGLNVLDAAARADVKHIVYSSGAAAEPVKGVPGPKTDIELAIVTGDVPYTVFRPVAFMENYAGQQKRIARDGIKDSRQLDRMLHFISIPDIGFFVAEAFDSPKSWQNVAINIASDEMTVAELVEVFSEVMEQPIAYTRVPLDEYLESFPKILRPLFRWYDEVGYEADVPDFRARYPQLQTLEGYMRAEGWAP